MLSYRHGFHAGNHGDVLKHWVQITALRQFNQKSKPYCYIDTHAGAGRYPLKEGLNQKNQEIELGFKRLWLAKDRPTSLQAYVDLVAEINQIHVGAAYQCYPGSPAISQALMRDTDHLWLFELHPADFKKLQIHCGADARIQMRQSDGLQGLKALLPPAERRGLIMIDPAWEVKADYHHIFKALEAALERFATGSYCLWYPLLRQRENVQFRERLAKFYEGKWLDLQLRTDSRANAKGMFGSGVFMLNPPWLIQQEALAVLTYLAELLGVDDQGDFAIRQSEQL